MPKLAVFRLQKIVFSTTLEKVSWSNTRLVKGGLVEEVRALKESPGALAGKGDRFIFRRSVIQSHRKK